MARRASSVSSVDAAIPTPGVLLPQDRVGNPAAATAQPADSRAKASAKLSAEARHELITHAAYLRAEQRGFAPGQELADWLAAEHEIDLLLANHPPLDVESVEVVA